MPGGSGIRIARIPRGFAVEMASCGGREIPIGQMLFVIVLMFDVSSCPVSSRRVASHLVPSHLFMPRHTPSRIVPSALPRLVPPWQQMDRGGVACRVERVDYELPARGDNFEPPVAAAVVSLRASSASAAAGPAMGGGEGEHQVSLRPSDCADFLVPRRKVMQVTRGLLPPFPPQKKKMCFCSMLLSRFHAIRPSICRCAPKKIHLCYVLFIQEEKKK